MSVVPQKCLLLQNSSGLPKILICLIIALSNQHWLANRSSCPTQLPNFFFSTRIKCSTKSSLRVHKAAAQLPH